jgi:uncharacterized protein
LLFVLIVAVAFPYALKINVDLDFMRVLDTRQSPVDSSSEVKGPVRHSGEVAGIGKNTQGNHRVIFRLSAKRGDMLSGESIQHLREVVAGINHNFKDASVFSILNAKVIAKVNGQLKKQPLIKVGRVSAKESVLIRQEISNSYKLLQDLVSRDLNTATLVVSYKAKNRKSAYLVYTKLVAKVYSYQNSFSKIKDMSRFKVKVYELSTLSREVPLLCIGMIVLLALIVGFLTRNIMFSGIMVLLTLFNLLISAAFMSIANISLNIIGLVLPFLVIIVGSTEVIHLLCAYVKGLRKYNASSVKASVFMIRDVGYPCVITSLTTIIGIYSFAFSNSLASQETGFAGGTAMLICGLSSLFFLPMFVAFVPGCLHKYSVHSKRISLFDSIRKKFVFFVTHNELWLSIVLVVVGVVAVFFITKVSYDYSPFRVYVDSHEFSQQLKSFRDDFGGIGKMNVEIQSPRKQGFANYGSVVRVSQLSEDIEKRKEVSSVFSYAGVVDSILSKYNLFSNQGDNGGANYVNKLKRLASQNGTSLVNDDFDKITIFVRYSMGWMSSSSELKRYIESQVDKVFGKNYKVNITFSNMKKFEVFHQMFRYGVESYLICALIIFMLFCLQYKSVVYGLYAVVPNAFAVLLLFAYMGADDIKLNPLTFSSFLMMLSIGIDFTVHIFMRYKRDVKLIEGRRKVMGSVIDNVVGPLFISTIAIVFPMLLGCLSSNIVIVEDSKMISLGLLFAFVSNILIAPLILRRQKVKKTA